MFFPNRTWCLTGVPSSQALAEMLTRQTWPTCSGFFVTGHRSVLFLNDATGPDGDQEYVVMYRNRHGIIGEMDSITVNSFTHERIAWLVDQFLELPGETVQFAATIRPDQIKTPRQHRDIHCPLCV